MSEEQENDERPFVERWVEEQQEWQKTMLNYMDTMASNEEFLVHLGNAMRGSLLAGKPYPGTAAPQSAEPDAAATPSDEPTQADERLDRILFTLNQMQGQLSDLQMKVDALAEGSTRESAGPADASPGDHERSG